MIGCYEHLHRYPSVFQSLTGLRLKEFEVLLRDVLPRYEAAEAKRLARPERQRQPGGGRESALAPLDQRLLVIIWLRQYPTHEVLGYLFGVSDSTVSRLIARIVPLLEASGRDTMRMPDPGRKRRRQLDDLLRDTPELAVVIDSFEQRVQRPKQRAAADTYYSGKKKQHTLKSQGAVDEETGEIVDVSASVCGPTHDLALFRQSGLAARLPAGVGAVGDLGYVGLPEELPVGLAATPRRKPRGQPRPAEDVAYNTAFSRRRIIVEHSIGRIRRFQAVTQPDRHHRLHHHARGVAIVGLVNRQLRHHRPYAA